ncbi:alpha/beta fold hydrolase [Epibacterium sp. Ofav1-8]|uniref:alpha/beta fold hydrolase n=1 Tax=Epibacterium sp. Ofav1-8 TaxID=2917735 RepID=UPI001EF5B18C|nr:alpha/beta fold hydrolase [Epibacterium sp. Ofav1-8]MCG7622097.1 alpha/beta fold hydrolase [Epibacterium sp. Ofav1-8]
MADILLVHGSCHGAWCWRDLIPALTAYGHTVRTIDLPGHGDGRSPADVSLDDSCRAVAAQITPDTIVVGHSWAGFPITGAVAHACPRGLIYLCAYVPISGMSLIDMRRAGPRQTIGSAAVKSEDGHSYTIHPDAAPELFYHDCPPDAVSFALDHICPQPIRPQATPLTVPDRWSSLPKHYIRCTQDRTIPPEYQASMTADWPDAQVHVLDSAHSPFFAAPGPLARLIDQITANIPDPSEPRR